MTSFQDAGRRAGVLLHITSLPGTQSCGCLSADAFRFADFLAASGFQVWQMLPLGPTHEDLSPYQTTSIHAGNPGLISLALLSSQSWAGSDEYESVDQAAADFFDRGGDGAHSEFREFVDSQSHWLPDYALYQVLKDRNEGRPWTDWPKRERDRDVVVLDSLRVRHADELKRVEFEQFVFFTQWRSLKDYANGQGIQLFGDMPIFVAHDSADVWARPDLFLLDSEGRAEVVTGVPPDYFSETGQRWGNPHYRWDRMQADNFSWWVERLRTQLMLFDLVRVDHFRGFDAVWEIPAGSETGEQGQWVPVPGQALFNQLISEFPELPLVAEDLGVITDSVETLRDHFGFPGMKILQFAFGGDSENPYLPHNHVQNAVVYTGTHDNDTTVGWYEALDDETREHVQSYLDSPGDTMPWPLIRAALASVCALAVVPMQDLLELDAEHRMNIPGVAEDNWRWRFQWGQVETSLATRLTTLNRLYGRSAGVDK